MLLAVEAEVEVAVDMVALESIDVHADEHVPRAAKDPQVVIHCQMRGKLQAVDMLEPIASVAAHAWMNRSKSSAKRPQRKITMEK